MADYVNMNKKFMNIILDWKADPSADSVRDYIHLNYHLTVRIQKFTRTKAAPKLQYNRRLNDLNLNEKYVDSVKSRHDEQKLKGNK